MIKIKDFQLSKLYSQNGFKNENIIFLFIEKKLILIFNIIFIKKFYLL